MRIDDDARLWITVLTPPLAWAAHLQTSYSLAPQACAWGSRSLLLVVSLVLLVATVFSSVLALRLWRERPPLIAHGAAGAPEEIEPAALSRARFMAAFGFASGCLFGLVIVGQTIPMFFLRLCD
ncbi:MAG TPA: hypothetical protein VGF48_02650 [Thermoanaerobaculia bacterium]|jgi:hypothetical protein